MVQIFIMLLCITVIFTALLMSVSTWLNMCEGIVDCEAEEDYKL